MHTPLWIWQPSSFNTPPIACLHLWLSQGLYFNPKFKFVLKDISHSKLPMAPVWRQAIIWTGFTNASLPFRFLNFQKVTSPSVTSWCKELCLHRSDVSWVQWRHRSQATICLFRRSPNKTSSNESVFNRVYQTGKKFPSHIPYTL